MSRFQLRKSVHINLAKSTHSELRILLFKKGLSMQEVIEHFSVLLVEGDDYLNNLLNKIEYNIIININNNIYNVLLLIIYYTYI